MSARARTVLWLLLGLGVVGRVALAFATFGQDFDMDSLRIVAAQLGDDPLHLYSAVNAQFELSGFAVGRWPYPPGYFPWLAATVVIEKAFGLPFHGVVQLAPIAADAAIACIVQEFLRRRGAGEGARLAAVAAVMAGPVFVAISGYHGQIDAVAILPAVAALFVWTEAPPQRRALYAGLLLGIGGAIKVVPLFVFVALLPSARSRREVVVALSAAACVLAVAVAPFALADPDGIGKVGEYSGAPGLGGISLLAQPELSTAVLTKRFEGVEVAEISRTLYDHGKLLVLLALAGVGAIAVRYRPPPEQAAALVWLTFLAVTPAFFFQYLVWAFPYFLMAGYVRAVILAQALALPPLLAFYLLPWESDRIAAVYLPCMTLLWLGWVVALGLQVRRVAHA